MHNYQSAILNNNKYSIMSPIFCLYHGFMDYLLEVMIRKIKGNHDTERRAVNGVLEGMSNYASLSNVSESETGRYMLWAKYFKKNNGFDPTFTDYPIFFWMDFYTKGLDV